MERPPGRRAEPAILSPSALAEDARFLRGTLTHALLEHLPALPRERWATAAEAFVAGRGAQAAGQGAQEHGRRDAGRPARAGLHGAVRARGAGGGGDRRRDPPPHGRGPALRLAGKIDRLVREGDTILIVDYKTNRPPPTDVAKVAEAYLLQLAAYRLAVSHIFSRQRVRAAILWTDGPRIMEIPGDDARCRSASALAARSREP